MFNRLASLCVLSSPRIPFPVLCFWASVAKNNVLVASREHIYSLPGSSEEEEEEEEEGPRSQVKTPNPKVQENGGCKSQIIVPYMAVYNPRAIPGLLGTAWERTKNRREVPSGRNSWR